MATACLSDSYYRHRQLAVEPAIAAWEKGVSGDEEYQGTGSLLRPSDQSLDNPTHFWKIHCMLDRFQVNLEVVPKLASGCIKGRQVPWHWAFFIGQAALALTLFLHTRNRTRSCGTTYSHSMNSRVRNLFGTLSPICKKVRNHDQPRYQNPY